LKIEVRIGSLAAIAADTRLVGEIAYTYGVSVAAILDIKKNMLRMRRRRISSSNE